MYQSPSPAQLRVQGQTFLAVVRLVISRHGFEGQGIRFSMIKSSPVDKICLRDWIQLFFFSLSRTILSFNCELKFEKFLF
jgi:hypothetical protein